jgi:hypothetical protein
MVMTLNLTMCIVFIQIENLLINAYALPLQFMAPKGNVQREILMEQGTISQQFMKQADELFERLCCFLHPH